jgi:hypothetical protein
MNNTRIKYVPTSRLVLLFKSSQICCVTILILGLQPRLKHDKGFGLQNCPRIQAHFHKCEKVQNNESQHSQVDFPFGI